MRNVFDIVQPKDEWSKGYAMLEYLRVGLNRINAKNIPVLDQNGCRIVDGELKHDDWCSCG